MTGLQSETDFFHDIAEKVISLVNSYGDNVRIAKQKAYSGDYATEVDVAVENLIVNEIKQKFPDDAVLAEEGHSDVEIPESRIWIIDPICGTDNLGRSINNFCTNIALSDNKKLIAACVVDHSQHKYYWSVGSNTIYEKDKEYAKPTEEVGTVIDADFGALPNVDKTVVKRHSRAITKLLVETDYNVISLNTSLGFAYVALSKVDGIISVYNHPWDVCASSFLVQQSGGTISGLEGEEWTVNTCGFIAANSKEVHSAILNSYLDAAKS